MTSTGQYSIVDRGGWLLIEPFTIKNYIDAALPIFECFFWIHYVLLCSPPSGLFMIPLLSTWVICHFFDVFFNGNLVLHAGPLGCVSITKGWFDPTFRPRVEPTLNQVHITTDNPRSNPLHMECRGEPTRMSLC